jgi:hypothetical protein
MNYRMHAIRDVRTSDRHLFDRRAYLSDVVREYLGVVSPRQGPTNYRNPSNAVLSREIDV